MNQKHHWFWYYFGVSFFLAYKTLIDLVPLWMMVLFFPLQHCQSKCWGIYHKPWLVCLAAFPFKILTSAGRTSWGGISFAVLKQYCVFINFRLMSHLPCAGVCLAVAQCLGLVVLFFMSSVIVCHVSRTVLNLKNFSVKKSYLLSIISCFNEI